MGKISTYPTDTSVSAGDKVIGTDNDSSSATKNYVMSDIAAYVAGTIPDPTLESVLTAGNTATEDINLSGDVNAVGVTANGVSCSTLASTTISVTGTIADSSGDVGTNGQLLTSTGTGTNWSNTVTDLTVTGTLTSNNVSQLASAPLTFIKMNNLGVGSAVLLLSPGAGNYIQVVSATFKLDFNTIAYSFSTDLTLGTTTADQFTLPFGVVNSAADAAAAFLPASGATAGLLGENEPLILGTATNPSPTTGDSPVTIEILYRIITV